MTAALRLVRIDELTYGQIYASDRVRSYRYADPAVDEAIERARTANNHLLRTGRSYEAAPIRGLINRIEAGAVLLEKLGPIHVVHKGILRATWGEYAKVLAAVARLPEANR